MLNLIFISNSPKAQYLKTVLQPLLKVIIDVVPDFDHGLKDVFEKRPATVCIQDQIAGVTGESVARHIQMLLGSGAPRFMLMHAGNSKVKPIKGLFEYVIDLNQPDEDLARDFQGMLQGLLGDQWHKISITSDSPPPSVEATDPVGQPKADQLVDELLLDFKSASLPSDTAHAGNKEPIAQTPVDEMAELLLEQARQARQNEVPTVETVDEKVEGASIPESRLEKALASVDGTVVSEQFPDGHTCHVKPVLEPLPVQRQQPPITPSFSSSPSAVRPEPKPVPLKTASPARATAPEVVSRSQKTAAEAAVPVAPSEFRVNRDKPSGEEHIPEDLLLAFEKNYRSRNVYVKWALLALLIVLGVSAAGWYAVRQKPQIWASLKQLVMPSASPVVAKRSSTLVTPAQIEQKKAPLPATPQVAAQALPSFIPQAGHDRSYAAKNPGWERYVGKSSEVRVFKSGTSVKAVQVLAPKGNSLPSAFLKSALKELTGSSDYSITSRETKSGLLVLRGAVAQKADIIVYEKESLIRAFVISLN